MPEAEKKLTERDLVALVDEEFDNAIGSEGGEIAQERAKAWEYYLSKLFGNEEENESQVVTSDVSEVVDGMMPSLLRIFTTSENLVDFKPTGKEDVTQAEQESDYVNHVFFEQNPSFLILFTWFFDALVGKNGIVKCWWDETEEVTTESYEGLTDNELGKLLEDEELEIDELEERQIDDPFFVEGEVLGELGIQIEAPQVTVNDVTFKRTRQTGQVKFMNVPPEEYRISNDAKSIIPDGARMVGHERTLPRSDLLDMGFEKDQIGKLPVHGIADDTQEKQTRKDKVDDRQEVNHDKSQDLILVKEAYLLVDFDNDGHSELRQIITAGGEVLLNELADRQPFHVICPRPLPHKHVGRSVADDAMDIQLVHSTLWRQSLMNLYHTNNPGHGVWEQGIGDHTMDDLLSTKIGSVKRFRRPPQESYLPITVPFLGNQTFQMMDLLESKKRDRTGVSADSEGLSPEALKNIQQSVLTQAMDIARMKIEAVVRIFAETGIKSLFQHIHQLLLTHQEKGDIVELRNQWVAVDPTEWRDRKNMKVKIGLGIGTREQNLLHLNAIWEKQTAMVDKGGLGLTISLKNLYNTASEFVKNANLKSPDLFFTDPGDQQVPKDEGQSQLAAAQLEATKRQLDLANKELEIQRERNMMQHEREVQKIQNTFDAAIEGFATKLTELELKFNTNVPGAKV